RERCFAAWYRSAGDVVRVIGLSATVPGFHIVGGTCRNPPPHPPRTGAPCERSKPGRTSERRPPGSLLPGPLVTQESRAPGPRLEAELPRAMARDGARARPAR